MPKKKLPIAWDEGKRLWIKCLNCGLKWYPDARKWKDKDDDKDNKVVRCPKCHSRNPLPPSVVRSLKRQARKYPQVARARTHMYKEYMHYWGDFPNFAFTSPAILTVTSSELQVESYKAGSLHKDWCFSIPLEKVRRIDLFGTKEITAWRIFLIGVLFAAVFKKKQYFLRITYEDDLGLMEDLMLTTFQQDDRRHSKKVALIQNIRSAIRSLKS